ncbi:MAG: formyl transferase [Candidatus Omnitrophica bacterium]|nr:formyl transferase [Candidatus Omnitrophota bacterium]
MKIVFMGCVQFSESCLRDLLKQKNKHYHVAGVVTRKASSFNSDFTSLQPVAARHKIPYFLADQHNEENLVKWLHEICPDVIYCFGWSWLLQKTILEIPRLGVIGYHPAKLPYNRGRHPIIWALALGLKQTASTFFFMDEKADTGDILDQKNVKISKTDYAHDLYQRLLKIAKQQIPTFSLALASGEFKRGKQPADHGNTWRKRSEGDGAIDWRMSAETIYNLIRALAKPYPGAVCRYNGKKFAVWRSQVVTNLKDNCEPGKILNASKKHFTIKCGGASALQILSHDIPQCPKAGEYL